MRHTLSFYRHPDKEDDLQIRVQWPVGDGQMIRAVYSDVTGSASASPEKIAHTLIQMGETILKEIKSHPPVKEST